MRGVKTLTELRQVLKEIQRPVFGGNAYQRFTALALFYLAEQLDKQEAKGKQKRKRTGWQQFLAENMGKGLPMAELSQQFRETREGRARTRKSAA